MLRDYLDTYYLDKGMNCAECTLHAADEAWGLNLDPLVFKAVGGFGGGVGCGNLCGAVAGGVAALGFLYIDGETAHQNPLMQAKAALLVNLVKERLGSELCDYLKPRYRSDEERCLPTVRLIADLLEEVKNTEIVLDEQ